MISHSIDNSVNLPAGAEKQNPVPYKAEDGRQARFQRMRDDLVQAKALLTQFTRELDAWLLQT